MREGEVGDIEKTLDLTAGGPSYVDAGAHDLLKAGPFPGVEFGQERRIRRQAGPNQTEPLDAGARLELHLASGPGPRLGRNRRAGARRVESKTVIGADNFVFPDPAPAERNAPVRTAVKRRRHAARRPVEHQTDIKKRDAQGRIAQVGGDRHREPALRQSREVVGRKGRIFGLRDRREGGGEKRGFSHGGHCAGSAAAAGDRPNRKPDASRARLRRMVTRMPSMTPLCR